MNRTQSRTRRWLFVSGKIVLLLAVIYLLLLIPDSKPPQFSGGEHKPFIWNQNERWSALEESFKQARQEGCERLSQKITVKLGQCNQLLEFLAAGTLQPGAGCFAELEDSTFSLAPMIAACSEKLSDYIQHSTRLRMLIKKQSQYWDMNSEAARHRIYRSLYGTRSAIEEVMLQIPPNSFSPLVQGIDEPSKTPSTILLGVTIHSGDILVSRGGAPTSALIARGNDYPGNFSHVALVYVDDKTNNASVIESHIERGVAIATLQDYLSDKKLRVMVLRLRSDLPALIKDPMLPHKTATRALEEAEKRHIPYDFEMDYNDASKLFCSEVASAPYREFGINLWMGISHISTPGIRSWLGAFGVTHFETQEPSDLEYDPQLSVVAEWRDPETLFNDHVDNAVIDVMLEGAEAGEQLNYQWYMLPFGRIAKFYSKVLNLFGRVGPVPEGMSASAALRNKQFSSRHKMIKERVILLAEEFKIEHGYRPPYWKLVEIANRAKRETQ
jgi:hypothetical protein